MNTVLCLATLLFASPSLACDWQVSKKVSPMTDKHSCLITSASAHLGISVEGRRVLFVSGSAYTEPSLTVRVDDLPPISLSRKDRSTEGYEPHARTLLEQILHGSRIRVQFRDYPQSVTGDAPICDLPKLITDCQSL